MSALVEALTQVAALGGPVVMILLAMSLVMLFPEIALWLPSTMIGR